MIIKTHQKHVKSLNYPPSESESADLLMKNRPLSNQQNLHFHF